MRGAITVVHEARIPIFGNQFNRRLVLGYEVVRSLVADINT